jgi:hypothetical protein
MKVKGKFFMKLAMEVVVVSLVMNKDMGEYNM